ncbi:MAG: helix-hairpin-helix domain-containing protein [Proteobacteria bacterium]|nr:helix-hairpin-helix domain-containing protein [Pseudomonadota bacterium]
MKSSRCIKYLVFLFIALFTLSTGFNAMADPKKGGKDVKPNPQKLVKQAVTAYENGEFQVALEKFNQAYEDGKREDSALLYNIGRVYESMADYNSANAYYKQFIMASGSDETARKDALERIKKNNETMEVLGTVQGTPKAPATGGKKGGSSSTAKAAVPAGGCIDINTASESELTKLPSIGKATAPKVIAGRPYNSPADIKKIKGISDTKFEKMAPMICPINGVGGGVAAPAPAPQPAPANVTKPAKEPKKPINTKAAGNTFDL